MRAVPPGLRHAAASPGGAAWFWLSRAQRRAALDNYATVLGLPPSDPEVARVARRAFQNYGRVLMDFLLVGSLTPQELVSRVTVEGREHLDAALAGGRGVIIAVPHMGAWDVSAAYAAALGYPVTTVAVRFPGSLNDAVIESRRRFGLEILELGRSAVRGIIRALEANGIVALMSDLEHGPGIDVRFFGRRATVPGGPAAIALKTGAPLMTAGQWVDGPSRFHIRLDPMLSWTAAETKEGLMQRVMSRIEDLIRERPDQWFAFRPIFKPEG